MAIPFYNPRGQTDFIKNNPRGITDFVKSPRESVQPAVWPDFISGSDSSTAITTAKTTSANVLNALQPTIERSLRTVSGDQRKMGPVYGPTSIGGKVDIVEQVGTHLYIRALVCIGEIEQISSVRINDLSYLTGDPTSDPNYQGDWEAAATWTGGHALPYSAAAGEIYLYGGSYYQTNQAFTVTAYTGTSNPAEGYSAYFDAMITGATVNTYTGTTTQGVDPLLAAAGGDLAGYDETLTGTWNGVDYGIAYVVLKLLLTEYTGGFPRVTVSLNGLKVYDPRTSLTAYNTNPALACRDLITSPLYGLSASVDDMSVSATANNCDTAFADGALIQIGLAVAPPRPDLTLDWLDVLRAYAMCWIDIQGGTFYLIPDAVTDTSGAIVFDGGSDPAYELASLPTIESTPGPQRPNRVRVLWTGGTETAYVEAETAAVTAGTAKAIEEELKMPGLFSEEMAQRFANYRLALSENEWWRTTFSLFDDGLNVRPGDVWTITSPNGLSAQPIRILSLSTSQLGDYRVTAGRYSASVYASP